MEQRKQIPEYMKQDLLLIHENSRRTNTRMMKLGKISWPVYSLKAQKKKFDFKIPNKKWILVKTPYKIRIWKKIKNKIMYRYSRYKRKACPQSRFFKSNLHFTQNLFFQLYWHKTDITLCKFKVYSVMIWYRYILWNVYHNKVNIFITIHDHIFYGENILDLLLATFNYSTIVTMLYIRYPKIIYPTTGSLYP